MADHSKFQQRVIHRYYEHFDTIALQKLSEIVSEIYLAEANKPVKLWERAKNLLSRIAAEDPRVAQIIAKKDVQGLARLANELNAGLKGKRSEIRDQRSEVGDQRSEVGGQKSEVGGQKFEVGGQKSEMGAGVPLGDETGAGLAAGAAKADDPLASDILKRAMKAFRKRLKLTRLDDESRLGRTSNPMSAGRHSQVLAIMPPREFPSHVWAELAKQGKLKTSDGVFYELAEQ